MSAPSSRANTRSSTAWMNEPRTSGSASGSRSLTLELALDQPSHRAGRKRLECTGGDDLAMADVAKRLLGERARRRRPVGDAVGAGGRVRERGRDHPLPFGRRLVDAPDDVRQQPPATPLAPAGCEQLGDVLQERRRDHDVAVLVGAAIAEGDTLGRARHARVQQVALAVERIARGRQRQTRSERQLASALVTEEGISGDGSAPPGTRPRTARSRTRGGSAWRGSTAARRSAPRPPVAGPCAGTSSPSSSSISSAAGSARVSSSCSSSASALSTAVAARASSCSAADSSLAVPR